MPEQFITTYAQEHRQMRDALLELIEAFENNDSERALEAIEEMAALAGPHFQHEQEALYPALAEAHGEEQVEKLVEEHGEAVEAARQLAELAEQEELDEQAAAYGAELARQLLPHVSEPDELAVMVEVLEPETLKELHKAHKEAKKRGATLAAVAKGAKKKARKGKVTVKAARKRAAKPSRVTAPKTGAPRSSRAAKRRRK